MDGDRSVRGLLLLMTAVVGAFSGCCVSPCRTGPGLASPGLGPAACATECGGPACGTPMRWLLTCGAGCGEVYCDEWINDPPSDCDPCDPCGNHVGPNGRWAHGEPVMWEDAGNPGLTAPVPAPAPESD